MPKITDLAAASLPLSGSETVYVVQGGNSRRTTVADVGRSGENAFVATTSASVGLGAIPSYAKEIDVIFNGVGYAAGQGIGFQFVGATGHSFFVSRHVGNNGVTPEVLGQDGDTFFTLDGSASAQSVAGMLTLRRIGSTWGISGTLRRSASFMITYSGLCNFGSNTLGSVAIFSSVAMTGGTAACKWRG